MKNKFLLNNHTHSAEILVVGGGPAGLATAIEAAMQGDEVTVLERRLEYTRRQSLFLTDTSLALLNRWGVDLPELHIAHSRPDERMGFVEIHHLENQLAARAKALGVKVEQAKFVDSIDKEVIAERDGKKVRFSYDILIGADGAHSQVRKKLGIGVLLEGKASGISAVIPFEDASRPLDASPPIQTKWGFARRITTPTVSIVFLQSKNRLTQQEILAALGECGWLEEARLLEEQQPHSIDNNIKVLLQRASCFSDPKRGAIVVGDAAATASFFEGMGANTALTTASIAGRNLQLLKQGETSLFDREMQEATHALLEDSRYLFGCDACTSESYARI